MKTKTAKLPTSHARTAYGLLSEVVRLILQEPKRYDQGTSIERVGEDYRREKPPSCGTVGCVAGWVATLKRQQSFGYDSAGWIAEEVLGISEQQGDELFDEKAANGPSQTLTHARSGAAHIRRFQKKYAKQLKAKKV